MIQTEFNDLPQSKGLFYEHFNDEFAIELIKIEIYSVGHVIRTAYIFNEYF